MSKVVKIPDEAVEAAREAWDGYYNWHQLLAAALIYTWGTRCSEYQEGCRTCGVWDEFDGLQRQKAEIASLLNLLADARTENMKLRAEIERLRAWNAEIALNARHFAEALRKIADHPTGGVGCNPEGFVKDARAALEGK